MTSSASDPRSEETRRRLVAAGLELFARHGYDAVTTRQLAETAGVNQAAIPYHFGGKQGVYLAVAEHIAGIAGEHLRTVLTGARTRLAAAPAPATAAALLLEVTHAAARLAFEPGYSTIWLIFLSREQFHPSSAFERLFAAFAGPMHACVGELLACLTGTPATAPDTILLAHAYLGQIIGFVAARASLNRRLGRGGDFGPAEAAAAIAAIDRMSRYAIAGMRAAHGGWAERAVGVDF